MTKGELRAADRKRPSFMTKLTDPDGFNTEDQLIWIRLQISEVTCTTRTSSKLVFETRFSASLNWLTHLLQS